VLENMLNIIKIIYGINRKKTIFKGWFYGGYNMAHIARKSLFVFTTVMFVIFATNIMLVLHVACEHDSKEPPHSSPDSSHCPVCKKLLTSLTSFNVEPQILFVDRPAEQHTVHFQQNINLSGFHPVSTSPRGPPA